VLFYTSGSSNAKTIGCGACGSVTGAGLFWILPTLLALSAAGIITHKRKSQCGHLESGQRRRAIQEHLERYVCERHFPQDEIGETPNGRQKKADAEKEKAEKRMAALSKLMKKLYEGHIAGRALTVTSRF
jgi:hypothetical protein